MSIMPYFLYVDYLRTTAQRSASPAADSGNTHAQYHNDGWIQSVPTRAEGGQVKEVVGWRSSFMHTKALS
jgi:hypothetical protein